MILPFLIVETVLCAVLFFVQPGTAGLYTFLPEAIPFAAALPFLFFKDFRKALSHRVYAYFGITFALLAADYLIYHHAGLVLLAAAFLPLFATALIKFVIWNYHRIHEKESLTALALSTLSWTLFALSFPPLYLGPGAVIFLAPWFIVLFRYSLPAAIFGTFWSGMLYNAINYYWIYNVMKVGPAGFILFGLFLLIAFFSAYNTFAAFIFVKARDIKVKGCPVFLAFFPFFYAGLEMTRSIGEFSFPWSHLGYVFGNHLELLQALSLIGVFGYSAIVIACNMSAAIGFIHRRKILIALPAIVIAALFVYGHIILAKPEAQPFHVTDPKDAPTLALVQPSIHQTNKWSPEYYDSVIAQTWQLVQDSVNIPQVNLLVLPETAIPDFLQRRPKERRDLGKMIEGTDTRIFIGALAYDRDGTDPRPFNFYNSGFLFAPGERKPLRYDKMHLVPFSERIPFDDVIPILNYVNFGEGDFVAGKEIPVREPYSWTPFICYEAIYGSQIREAIRKGSRLMVNITNDGWFGISTAPGQHLNLVRYRAVENGYPVARDVNSGITAFIDQYGHISGQTKLFEKNVVIRRIPLRSHDTLYVHIGDAVEDGLLAFFFIYIAALGTGCIIRARKKAKA